MHSILALDKLPTRTPITILKYISLIVVLWMVLFLAMLCWWMLCKLCTHILQGSFTRSRYCLGSSVAPLSQWTHNVAITSLLRQNDVATSFWRNNDVIILRHVSADVGYGKSVDSLQWRHNGRDGVSNHQPRDCLLNRLFRSKKTSKLRVTGLCAGNSPVTGEFPAQRASNAENASILWRHHVLTTA